MYFYFSIIGIFFLNIGFLVCFFFPKAKNLTPKRDLEYKIARKMIFVFYAIFIIIFFGKIFLIMNIVDLMKLCLLETFCVQCIPFSIYFERRMKQETILHIKNCFRILLTNSIITEIKKANNKALLLTDSAEIKKYCEDLIIEAKRIFDKQKKIKEYLKQEQGKKIKFFSELKNDNDPQNYTESDIIYSLLNTDDYRCVFLKNLIAMEKEQQRIEKRLKDINLFFETLGSSIALLNFSEFAGDQATRLIQSIEQELKITKEIQKEVTKEIEQVCEA